MVQWNPKEAAVLASGSYDKTVRVLDVRAPASAALCWSVGSDVEVVQWNPNSPQYLFVSCGTSLLLLSFNISNYFFCRGWQRKLI